MQADRDRGALLPQNVAVIPAGRHTQRYPTIDPIVIARGIDRREDGRVLRQPSRFHSRQNSLHSLVPPLGDLGCLA